jgi:CheY-like chemotaxis protein
MEGMKMGSEVVDPRPGVVLVVEDDEDLRSAMEAVLLARGHRVATAGDGAEALAWLREGAGRRPCLVLLDLMMPGMNGFELMSVMNADPVLATIPVVVITGAGARVERRAADFREGVLPKPVEVKDLLCTVSRYCCAHREQ